MDVRYNDTELQRLFAEMDVKTRTKALRGAFRREVGKVRRIAINNLRSGINAKNKQTFHSSRSLEKGIRAMVFKRTAGFRITIGTKKANRKTGKGEQGMHLNRFGLKKPVLIWAEGGTEPRSTKTQTRVFKRTRKGHSTGRMKRYAFMRTTQSQVSDTVTAELQDEVIKNVVKTAKKYGCK